MPTIDLDALTMDDIRAGALAGRPVTVLGLARSGGAQMAILLRPTPIDAVQNVVAQGEVLPQKSTLFEPKMISGLFGVSVEDPIV